ncbi:MAG TPA: trigger factor [Acidimicrobiia bacterium]|nr:trigger factor [Acidimicrobiia bacterium]
MDTSVETLEDNKVRLHIAIPEQEFESAIDAAFRKLASKVRIDGFRPGKAPRRVLEAQFGADAAREDALRDALPTYYRDALGAEELDTIAPPEIEITAGEESGDVAFDAVVELRPVVELVGYDDLSVTLEEYEAADDDAVDAQVVALRERFADLEDSSVPLTDGDYAEIDINGSAGGEPVDGLTAADFLYEVGSASVVPGLDPQLHGKGPGDIVEFTEELDDRFGDRAGDEITFRVLVKEAKKKVLPEATDEWVSEVTEFDTLDELRADLRRRLEMVTAVRGRMAMREKVLEAASDLVLISAPEPLVQSEMERRLREFAHQLEERGGTIAGYLESTGQTQEDLLAEVRSGADKAVLADLALRAVVAQEAIEASEEDVDTEIAKLAEQTKRKIQKVRRDLDRQGALDALRSDLARGAAMEFLIDHATAVDRDGNPIDLTLPESSDTDPAEPDAADPADPAVEEEPEA